MVSQGGEVMPRKKTLLAVPDFGPMKRMVLMSIYETPLARRLVLEAVVALNFSKFNRGGSIVWSRA
jgi:hypothetical protein